MKHITKPGPESKVTAALVKRVSRRVGRGIPIRLALAGEPVTQHAYERQLRRHPELAAIQDAAKVKFLDKTFDLILSRPGPLVRWLLERRHSDLFAPRCEQMASSQIAGAVIDPIALEDLLADPPPQQRTAGASGDRDRKAFCDFAWSGEGDENVLAYRDGNVVTIEDTFHANNIDAICGRFIAAFNRLGLKPHQIDGDEGGGGKLICDRLQSLGWRINRVNNGAAPRCSDHYANLAAEIWFQGAQQIARRQIVLPDDDVLRAQILDRKRVPNARGKLAIESKSDMKKRGVDSPDRADAVFGAMTPVRWVKSANIVNGNSDCHLWKWFRRAMAVFFRISKSGS